MDDSKIDKDESKIEESKPEEKADGKQQVFEWKISCSFIEK